MDRVDVSGGDMSDWIEYEDCGGPDGLDAYEYWVAESAAMKSAEKNMTFLGEYYESSEY